MRKVALVFVLYFFSLSVVAKSKENIKDVSFNPDLLYVAEFVSNFKTVDESLKGLREMGLMAEFEYDGVIKSLKERNISLDQKLKWPEIRDHQLIFGKYRLSLQDVSTFKTQDGVYIRLSQPVTADKFFLKTIEAFTIQKTSIFNSLFLQNANAQPAHLETDGMVSAALYLMSYNAMRVKFTALELGGAVVGMSGILTEQVVIGLANIIYKGVVICEGTSYKIDSGYDYIDKKKAYIEGKERSDRRKMTNNYKDINGVTDPYFSEIKGLLDAGIKLIGNSFNPQKVKSAFVTSETIESVFGNKKPECNPANAAKVQAAIKSSAQKIQSSFKYAQLKTKSKNETIPKSKEIKKKI